MIYVYAKANQMIEHDFTDDVAIVKAKSKRKAMKYFSKYYDDVKESHVSKIELKNKHVKILTDY